MPAVSQRDESSETAEHARQWATFAFARWRGKRSGVPAVPIPERDIRRLGLAPLVHRALAAADDPRASRFVADYRHSLTANMLRLTRVARVLDAFEVAGIRAVLLKGAAFLSRFSASDPALRPMSDVDVLVGGRSWDAAVDVLGAARFTPAAERYEISAAAAPGRSFLLGGGALDLEIDLHRAVEQWPLYTRLATQTLVRAERVGGSWLPAIPDAIACASVHRARHAFVWSCLDLIDVRCLMDALDDDAWGACVDDLIRTGALAATYATFRQALFALGDVGPADTHRLAMLAARLTPGRRDRLHRIAPEDGAFRPPLSLDRPLTRNLVIQPAVTGSYVRPLAGALVYLPLRVVDEWRHAGRAGAGAKGRIVRVWQHLRGGDRRVRASAQPVRH